ncbi:hypothetical protein ACE1AT_03430 [Pelatocladus sp. BLCC-F211]|uniref:hypothetical protein n=1 Tax=Pelatocladus sp. BLCC-F211 TaxID=3342752 RepID=UPI0035BADBCD
MNQDKFSFIRFIFVIFIGIIPYQALGMNGFRPQPKENYRAIELVSVNEMYLGKTDFNPNLVLADSNLANDNSQTGKTEQTNQGLFIVGGILVLLIAFFIIKKLMKDNQALDYYNGGVEHRQPSDSP